MTVSHVHDIIFEKVSEILKTNPHNWDFANMKLDTRDQLCKLLFHNYTQLHPSMRLTSVGFIVLRQSYQYWSCPLPEDWSRMANQGHVLLKFQKTIPAPYYWDQKNFYVFHSHTALEMQIVGNDLHAWCNTF